MGNWDMQLQYLREVYKKLDRLGENMGKETWLVKSNIDRKLYIWKEIDMEMTGVYQRLRMISSRNLASILDLIRIRINFWSLEATPGHLLGTSGLAISPWWK